MCGHRDAAEDIVQEVFMRLYRALREGQIVESPRAWAFTVARHEIGRRATGVLGGAPLEPLDILEHGTPGLWREDLSGIEAREFHRFLAPLSPREQEVLMLRLGELKYREIAAELNISTKSVCTMLSRALDKVRKAVQHPGVAQEPRKLNVESRPSRPL
jgi:RNA polymerase sigma factor (sigma-70 family)